MNTSYYLYPDGTDACIISRSEPTHVAASKRDDFADVYDILFRKGIQSHRIPMTEEEFVAAILGTDEEIQRMIDLLICA